MRPPAGEPRPELRHVEVALAIGLREAEERDVEPAAVVEVELVGLVDDGLRVDRRAEVEAAQKECGDSMIVQILDDVKELVCSSIYLLTLK